MITRRTFHAQMGGLALLPMVSMEKPDLILHGGTIITSNPAMPRAEAVAISGGHITAIGSNDDVMHLASPLSKKINLIGKTVLPGFIDAHSHPAYSGVMHLFQVDCDLRSIAAIKDAIRAAAAQKAPGEWVLGFKYDDTKTAEGRFLTRADLDEAAPDHPVFISHRGGHTGFVNSLALKMAGIDGSTPDPEGGRFDRTDGQLNGRLLETGASAVEAFIPKGHTREQHRDGVALISKMLAKSGITSVTDAYGSRDDFVAYTDAYQAGVLGTRIYCMIGHFDIDRMIDAGLRTGFGDEWVRLGGMKATCDGSISERTARLSAPYIGRPDDYGIIVTPDDKLYELARKAHAAGWQVGIHANGDVAVDITLGIYERLQKEMPKADPRFRLEHCTVINNDLVRRIAALGAIPTPFSTYVYFHGEKMGEYGKERLNHMFALRSFLDAGIKVTQSSDYPPGPYEPMMALQSSVTRTDMKGSLWGPKQRITVEEAIKIGTIHGAYASYEEKIKGSLEVGKLADIVVLDEDPTKADPFSLVDIPVERTMVGGKWVFES
ncbi:amidohydrolase [Kordiimonas sp.]|uniref:amidohydrolase n=1 Tax=Kordiimonas sp. TaxID=1970157 RepID=UPI003A93D50F